MFLLMYADDIVPFADTPEKLQFLLNSLHEYTERWGLKVNTSKTKIVVFRNSWQLHSTEHWKYDNDELEIVNTFRYLGLCLNYNGKFNITQKTLTLQARESSFLFNETNK